MPNKKIQVIDLTHQQQELKDLTNQQQQLKQTIQELTILKKKLQQLDKKKQRQNTKKKEQDTKKQTVKKKQDTKTDTQNTKKKKQDTKKQTQYTNKNCDKELLKIDDSFKNFPEFINFILKKRKARLYLNVPFKRKDIAKGLKAKYDGHKRDWYIDYSNPESVKNEQELIDNFLNDKKQYLIYCNRRALTKLFKNFHEKSWSFMDHICSIDWSKSLKNVRFPYFNINFIEKWVSTDNDANIKFDDDTYSQFHQNIDKIYTKWLESRWS